MNKTIIFIMLFIVMIGFGSASMVHFYDGDLSAGDELNMQYISSDTDVIIYQHDTYATQPFNAFGYIQEIIV